jgi:hypothetical protein
MTTTTMRTTVLEGKVDPLPALLAMAVTAVVLLEAASVQVLMLTLVSVQVLMLTLVSVQVLMLTLVPLKVARVLVARKGWEVAGGAMRGHTVTRRWHTKLFG